MGNIFVRAKVEVLLVNFGPSGVHAPAQQSGHYSKHYFNFSLSFRAFCCEQTWSLIGG